MTRYKKNNDGGYGNPPVKDQFAAGCKGGPGRPKGSSTMEGALKKVFRGRVPYLENGKPMVSLATVALAKRALQHGLSGSAKANEAARELAAKYGPEEPPEAPADFDLSILTDQELEWYGRLACKMEGKEFQERPVSPLLVPNSWSESTIEGIIREYTDIGAERSVRLISVGNGAYISAALPRVRSRADRLRPSPLIRADDADL